MNPMLPEWRCYATEAFWKAQVENRKRLAEEARQRRSEEESRPRAQADCLAFEQVLWLTVLRPALAEDRIGEVARKARLVETAFLGRSLDRAVGDSLVGAGFRRRSARQVIDIS